MPLFVFIIPFLFIRLLFYLHRRFLQTPIKLKDKIVLVTGASSGLGEACAKQYAKEGCKVVLCARNITQLNRVKNQIQQNQEKTGMWPLVYTMDVTKENDINNVIKDVEEQYGPIDVLLSNAGVSQRGSVKDTVVGVHVNLMNINYFGPVSLVKAVLPSMLKRKQGQIISIGSVQAKIAIPFRSAYSASKHASQAFFDSLRAEIANDNIYVTVVNPGYIQTNLSMNAFSGDGSKHGVMDATTASGMPPEIIAQYIVESTSYPVKELSIDDTKSTVARFIRVLSPSLYFKIMEFRAKSELKKLKKSS